MQTCFSSDDPEYLPVPCTIVVHDEARLGHGTIWGFILIVGRSKASSS